LDHDTEELAREQAYVDYAYRCLDSMRERIGRAADAAAGEVAGDYLRAWSASRLTTLADAERGLCFGRLDFEDARKPLYVGRRLVYDDSQQPVLVNWQAPAARPFYTASPAAPQGVTRRRRFKTSGRRLLELADELVSGSGEDGAIAVFDPLLEALSRERTQHMRDIVATIQADQYDLITRPLEGLLVVQGGPGTGKTAIGLHRASWLLYTYRRELARRGLLVVGPNPTFMEYVSQVLPALGEESVEQRAIGELLEGYEVERGEPPEVEQLKGDPRLADVIARAIAHGAVIPTEALEVWIERTTLRVPASELEELVSGVAEGGEGYGPGRERIRMELHRRLYAAYGRKLGSRASRSFEEFERAVRREGVVQRLLQRALPPVRAGDLVRRLLSDAARLAAAADGILDEDEQALLLRHAPRRGRWSRADLPLLDEAAHRLTGTTRTYGHVVVDEAQDLSPMQLRMVGRRAALGSLTLLGDVAQATGTVTYKSWHEVLAHLPEPPGIAVEELRLAYRVPREIMELALPLLPLIAPQIEPPVAYRESGEEPLLVATAAAALIPTALAHAAELSGRDGTTAVIAPESLLAPLAELRSRAGFDEDAPELAPAVELLTPSRAKGLEFDRVLVVEPALIVEEAPLDRGLRELYVALTRATRTLVVVHSRAVPSALTKPAALTAR
jgi:DNA helicase IV